MRVLTLLLFAGLANADFTASCNNTPIATGWTCVDGLSQWATSVHTVGPYHNAPVQRGDIVLVWANLTSVSGWTTQTITMSDNNGSTFVQWSKGLNSFSNPINQWVGAPFWAVQGADKTGYQVTCTINRNGASDGNCDDFGFSIVRGPSAIATAVEDASDWSKTVSSGSFPYPATVGNVGQTITTNYADLVFSAGNSESNPVQVDSPFVGLDPDSTVPDPMNYLSATVQAAPGSITFHQYMAISGANIGSSLVGLRIAFFGTGATTTFTGRFTGRVQ